jgi:uncharacterized membrane protein (UPF0127 family)
MVTVSRTSDGSTLWRLTAAQSWVARLRGLIGRSALESGEGIYLPGTNGVHMLFMRFPIDCLFVGDRQPDGSRSIVAVRENLSPWTGIVWWVRGARGAIEVSAGEASRVGLQKGDSVMLEDGWRDRS